MVSSFNIAIIGLGTVGSATVSILQQHQELLAARIGRPIHIAGVSARDQDKPRPVDISAFSFSSDPLDFAKDQTIDCVVELIGGAEGMAKILVKTALENGKHVITANKALIAHHGAALAAVAEKQGVMLAFEAAVAGGIPVLKVLRESLIGNQCNMVRGILNGTSNYILTEMARSKSAFDAILRSAQEKGYAEADPTFDIDGTDAAHKLAILAAIAFGTIPAMDAVKKEGMERITPADLDYAEELGYAIKIIGTAEHTEHGVIQNVCPALVPHNSPLASVDNALNAVGIDCDQVESVFLEGPGAGGGPTASAVVADIADIARGVRYTAFGIPTSKLVQSVPPSQLPKSRYYLRVTTNDQVGVLAEITRIYQEHHISVDIMNQPRHTVGEPAELVFVTHPAADAAIRGAGAAIGAMASVVMQPNIIRILS